MEKTIKIDGRDVRFKSVASTPRRYKAQFGRDLLQDLLKLNAAAKGLKQLKDDPENVDPDSISAINTDLFDDIAWVLAKTADPEIPEPMLWLDQFDIGMMSIIPEIQDLLMHSLGSTAGVGAKKKPVRRAKQ